MKWNGGRAVYDVGGLRSAIGGLAAIAEGLPPATDLPAAAPRRRLVRATFIVTTVGLGATSSLVIHLITLHRFTPLDPRFYVLAWGTAAALLGIALVVLRLQVRGAPRSFARFIWWGLALVCFLPINVATAMAVLNAGRLPEGRLQTVQILAAQRSRRDDTSRMTPTQTAHCVARLAPWRDGLALPEVPIACDRVLSTALRPEGVVSVGKGRLGFEWLDASRPVRVP